MVVKIDPDALRILENNRGGFNTYFIWPVRILGDLQSLKLKDTQLQRILIDVTPESLRIPHNPLGPDFVVQRVDEEYGIALGTFNKGHAHDIENSKNILKYFNLEPIRLQEAFIYQFVNQQKHSKEYDIREYRAGARRLQSYFKDQNNPSIEKKHIFKRLKQDWNMGLKPYEVRITDTLEDVTVQINNSGLITSENIEKEINLLNAISSQGIRKYKQIEERTKQIGKFSVGNIVTFLSHNDLLIDIKKNSYERGLEPFVEELDNLGQILGYSAGITRAKKGREIFFNLQIGYDQSVSSLFAIGLNPTLLSFSAIEGPDLKDTMNLFYAAEENFVLRSPLDR